MTKQMTISECKDLVDIVAVVIHYGADIKVARRRALSAKKCRRPADYKYCLEKWPKHWSIIDQIVGLEPIAETR